MYICGDYYKYQDTTNLALDWTTESPTERGWYWAISQYQKGLRKIVFVQEQESGKGFCVFDIGLLGHFEVNEFSHWLGPLPIPDLPEK